MKKITFLLLLTISTLSASARLFSVTANLNGANVVPAISTSNIGTLTGTFDDVTGLLNYSITYTSVPFYGRFYSGAAGTNGLEIIPTFLLNFNPPTNGTVTFGTTDITALLAGNIYLELEYSTTNLIRGQLAAVLIIDIFNNAAQNNFYGIGGYSYSQFIFPDGLQNTPYVVSGPSPQNDFSYAISANVGAITNSTGVITTTNSNTNIFIEMKSNNIRKFACKAYAYGIDPTVSTSNIISVAATTNLGNTVTQTASNGSEFVGFNLPGSENEYIVSVTASFQSTPSPARRIALYSIMVGDNTPQNVALNFDGVDDYVSTNAYVGAFATFQDFTVSCWIKPNATQPSSAINPDENDIISKWAGTGSGVNNNYPFVIRYLNESQTNPARQGRILVGQWDGTTFTTITSTVAVNDGKWHHVAFVRGSSSFSLYIDGTIQGSSVPDNVNNLTLNTTPVDIGRRGNGQNYFRGEIDEVRIWNIAKDQLTIQNERFCKTPPNATNLKASYTFSNGVPHDNNPLITQVQDASTLLNHGTLNNFAKTGNASNFVTGQVKYVRTPINGNGSSWSNAFDDLQSALTANTCNDLFEVWVAKGNAFYKRSITGDVNVSFNIPSGMRIYGGFAGDEKSINQRNMALIHSTNETTLSGDLAGNDTPFNFTTNRSDNSNTVVQITGSNASLDGFTIRGAGTSGGVEIYPGSTNTLFKNNKVIDNNFGINVNANNTTIANSFISGNKFVGVNVLDATALTIKNSLITNNGSFGVSLTTSNNTNISNSTIVSNGEYGMRVFSDGISNTSLKNTLIYDNASGGIQSGSGINNNITYSLVQGVTTGTGNLNGTTVNPQFVSPLGSGFGSLSLANLGDYRLKWCSLAINAGDNTGISPLDLDRKPRNFNGNTDMGAYEFLGNTPSQLPISIIWSTIDSPTYAGGAIQTITSDAKILAPAGAIDFKAPNSIILSPGFEARGVGKYFKAEIGANSVCTN